MDVSKQVSSAKSVGIASSGVLTAAAIGVCSCCALTWQHQACRLLTKWCKLKKILKKGLV
jgi:hypothetical protein